MDKIVWVDGGSKGNPGQGYGSWKFDDSRTVNRLEYPGVMTNNEAEYATLINALQTLKELGIQEATIYMDSLLVVKQLQGNWAINAPNLTSLNALAWSLLRDTKSKLMWRPRKEMVKQVGH